MCVGGWAFDQLDRSTRYLVLVCWAEGSPSQRAGREDPGWVHNVGSCEIGFMLVGTDGMGAGWTYTVSTVLL